MVRLNADGKRSLVSGIASLTLAIVAVALRFYTKRFTKAEWAADDWWIGLSLIGLCTWTGLEIWGGFKLNMIPTRHRRLNHAGLIRGGGGEIYQKLLSDSTTLQTYLKVCKVLPSSLWALS